MTDVAPEGAIARATDWIEHRLLHQRLREGDPYQRRRAQLAVVFAFISSVGACALGVNHLLYGVAWSGLLFTGFGIAGIGAVYVLRRTGSLLVAGNIIAGLWFLAMVGSTVSRGGLMSHGSMGVAAVPVVAVVLSGRRSGWFWCVMSLALLGALFGLDAAGIELADRAPPGARARIAFISTGLFVLLMLLMAAAHDAMKMTALAELARTEREKMAAETEAKLHEADRLAAVGRLAAAVAHEINNPLVYITGNVAYVREELESMNDGGAVELAEALDDVLEGAERVRIIVQDLNTFARAEERVGSVDIASAVGSAVRMAEHQIKHRAILRREIHTDAAVLANQARLGQVMLNLLVNAAHAIPVGRADENEIVVTARDHEPYVAIEVTDTGVGIPAEILARVTEPFFTTKGVGEGTGLGLAVCKNIIEHLGGRLEIESEVGRGTTVRVLLPRAEAPARKRTGRAGSNRSLPTVCRRVLVVDDDARVQRHIYRTLEGHAVEMVESGRAALDLLETDREFDLVLCDLMMPETTGAEVYAQIAQRFPELVDRFAVITGGVFSEELAAFLEQFQGYVLTKPFSDRRLRDLVERGPRAEDKREPHALDAAG